MYGRPLKTFEIDPLTAFTYIWRIENFSMCVPVENKYLDTSPFQVDTLDGILVFLRLYPMGNVRNSDYMSVYLHRSESDSGPEKVRLCFRFSLIKSNGDESTRTTKEVRLYKSEFHGQQHFVSRKKIFSKKEKYLPGDTLTIKCIMWRGRYLDYKHCVSEVQSVILLEQSPMLVELPDFDLFRGLHEVSIQSTYQEELFVLMVCVDSCDESDSESADSPSSTKSENLRFKIRKHATDKPYYLHGRISILDTEHRPYFITEGSHCYGNEEEMWTFPLSVKKYKILHEKVSAPPDYVLTLKCEFKISSGHSTCVILGTKTPKCVVPGQKGASLLSDFFSMYHLPTIYDVYFRVQDQTFGAHRSILASRSTVFRQLFREMAAHFRFLDQNQVIENAQSGITSTNTSEEAKPNVKDNFLINSSPVESHTPVVPHRLPDCKNSIQGEFSPEDMEVETNSAFDATIQNFQNQETSLDQAKHSCSDPVEVQKRSEGVGMNLKDPLDYSKTNVAHCSLTGPLVPTGNFVFSPTKEQSTRSFEMNIKCKIDGLQIVGSNLVIVSDMLKDTFQQMCRFMYTDIVEHFNFGTAKALYLAADKYKIPLLKKKCLKNLQQSLELKNIYEALIMARKYQEKGLEAATHRFIFKHMEDVLLSNEWQNFLDEEKELADNVLRFLRFKKMRFY